MYSARDKFLFLANEPALDLLNTTPVLAEGPTDLLENFSDLTSWLSAAGLTDEATAATLRRRWGGTREAEAAVARAKTLRESLRDLIAARLDGTAAAAAVPARAMGVLNDALRAASATTQIEWDERSGSFSRAVRHETDGTPAQAVTLLARAAATLLTERDMSLVRRCENPACVLHFYDTSKNHRRRWCSMEICGNRMKVAAHYRRHKEAGR